MSLRFLPASVHGPLDYTVGPAIGQLPELCGFAEESGAAVNVPRLLGWSSVPYSLITDYEWGVVPVLSMKQHLALDFAAGLLLAASPWLFGFAHRVWVPHVCAGLMEMTVALCTQQEPGPVRHNSSVA